MCRLRNGIISDFGLLYGFADDGAELFELFWFNLAFSSAFWAASSALWAINCRTSSVSSSLLSSSNLFSLPYFRFFLRHLSPSGEATE
jgi:hypothetical protein